MNLSCHALNIIHVVNFPFIQNLYGNLLASEYMKALLHFAECTLTKSLLNFVIANELIAHFYYFIMLLSLNGHFHFCFIHTLF